MDSQLYTTIFLNGNNRLCEKESGTSLKLFLIRDDEFIAFLKIWSGKETNASTRKKLAAVVKPLHE